MRFKNKITRERNRVTNTTNVPKEEKVLFFAKDLQVSSRILAVLSVEVSKEKVQVTKREKYDKKLSNDEIVAKYRRVPTKTYNKIEKYRIICGSNGKVSTLYNTVELFSNGNPKFNKNIGDKLTDKEFVKMYRNQCSKFKKIFASEYELKNTDH